MQGRPVIICRCEEVSEDEILAAIRKGDSSLESIKKRTRAGMGLCQGKTCRKLTARLLAIESGLAVEKCLPGSNRPPAGAVKLKILAESPE